MGGRSVQVWGFFGGGFGVFLGHPKSSVPAENSFSQSAAFPCDYAGVRILFVTFRIDNLKLLFVRMFSVSVCLSIFLSECRSV